MELGKWTGSDQGIRLGAEGGQTSRASHRGTL